MRLTQFLPEGREAFPAHRARASDGLVERWLGSRPALAAEERFREHLAETRLAEAEGGTVDGPQRSDLVVSEVGRGMAAEQCSTGEQKAMLIALVTAHARLVANQRRSAPVLLLDEIAAHLDESPAAGARSSRSSSTWAPRRGSPAPMRPSSDPLAQHAQFFTVRPGAVEGV